MDAVAEPRKLLPPTAGKTSGSSFDPKKGPHLHAEAVPRAIAFGHQDV